MCVSFSSTRVEWRAQKCSKQIQTAAANTDEEIYIRDTERDNKFKVCGEVCVSVWTIDYVSQARRVEVAYIKL